MMDKALMLLLAAVIAAVPVARAEEAPPVPPAAVPDASEQDKTQPGKSMTDRLPQGEDGRYSFHRFADGFVRLDGRTGQVSACSRRTVGWTCQVTPDDRDLFENEIARLRGENAVLKRELLSRGLPLPGDVKPAAPPPPQVGENPEHDLRKDADRMFAYVEKAWRRLVELLVNLQKDMTEKKG